MKCCLVALQILCSTCVCAAPLSGRISLLGNVSNPHQGDVGYDSDVDVLNADQESFRLMLDDSADELQWRLHLITLRQHTRGLPAREVHSSDFFRFDDLSHNWSQQRSTTGSSRVGYEVDHAYIKHNLENFSLGFGRQPIDWGAGRFWQPMNVFGAFAPTDLDTEYKPGIDTAVVNWYPSAFSSLEAVYALAPHDRDEIEDSSAVYYRRQAGQNSEVAMLAGSLFENGVYGASFESDWKGAGWRVEGVYYDLKENVENEWFWVAGMDYQINNGTLLSVEWYDNGLGVSDASSLEQNRGSLFYSRGFIPYLGQNVLGVSANRDVSPLLNANYTLLLSPLKNHDGSRDYSVLHQLNLVYSLSDESELVFSLAHASGKGLNEQNQVRSEFGHLPDSLTLIYRYYY